MGILLIAGCFGYLSDFAGSLMFDGYPDLSMASYVTLPATLGELGTCLWLLIVGIGKSKLPVAADG